MCPHWGRALGAATGSGSSLACPKQTKAIGNLAYFYDEALAKSLKWPTIFMAMCSTIKSESPINIKIEEN